MFLKFEKSKKKVINFIKGSHITKEKAKSIHFTILFMSMSRKFAAGEKSDTPSYEVLKNVKIKELY